MWKNERTDGESYILVEVGTQAVWAVVLNPPKGLPNPVMIRHESYRMSIRGPEHVSRSGYSQPSMLRFTISVHKVSSNEVLPFVQKTCREASAN